VFGRDGLPPSSISRFTQFMHPYLFRKTINKRKNEIETTAIMWFASMCCRLCDQKRRVNELTASNSLCGGVQERHPTPCSVDGFDL
jgi:hypothetical protein